MTDSFIGEIRLFAFNFVPMGWVLCNGQSLVQYEYPALFAVIGTTYGGDNQHFKVPNFEKPKGEYIGRAPMGMGAGPGLTPRNIGWSGGTSTVTLTADQMPVHSHSMMGETSVEENYSPAGLYPGSAQVPPPNYNYRDTSEVNVAMAPQMLASAGGQGPHENCQPALDLAFCIATEGLFPARH